MKKRDTSEKINTGVNQSIFFVGGKFMVVI